MRTTEVEQLTALAQNWREAEQAGDYAATEAFEDELYASVTGTQIKNLNRVYSRTGEVAAAETDHFASILERMWSNASARLDT